MTIKINADDFGLQDDESIGENRVLGEIFELPMWKASDVKKIDLSGEVRKTEFNLIQFMQSTREQFYVVGNDWPRIER